MIDDRKVQFVKKYYPNLMKVNVYTDRGFVSEVKRDIHEHFNYKTPLSMMSDVSVINICLTAQGKKMKSRVVTKKEGVMR